MSETREKILEVRDLGIDFGGLTAVNNLDMDIYRGEIYGLIGPNGAGKTTVFNMLTKVYQPTRGTIKIDGTDMAKLNPVQANKAGVARTFQNIRLFANMSVLDNVKTGMHATTKYSLLSAVLRLPSYYAQEKQATQKAMDLLKKYGIVFGTSICYTKDNIEAVTSDDFFNLITEKGAHFGFYFHFMPVGNNAVPELMPTPEQRVYMIKRIREVRSESSTIPFFPMDFQNDGEYVGGCIAGGRNYFHINSNGDAEPCVFIHFSNTNIKTHSILEMLQSPLFMAYHEGQPFNRNHLRPCPMLENPDLLLEMVHATGAHQTNQESPEEVEHLCAKCKPYAENWKEVADKEWNAEVHKKPAYENYTLEKREHPELSAFEHADGTKHIDVDSNSPYQANK